MRKTNVNSLIEYCKKSISVDLKQKTELELVRIAKDQCSKNNQDAKILLIEKYLPKIKAEAKKIFNGTYLSNQLDIMQTAFESVLLAINAFTENRKISSFPSCVSWHIFSSLNRKKTREDPLLKVNQGQTFKEYFYNPKKSAKKLGGNSTKLNAAKAVCYVHNPSEFHEEMCIKNENSEDEINISENVVYKSFDPVFSYPKSPEEELCEKQNSEFDLSPYTDCLTKKQFHLINLVKRKVPVKERLKILNISKQAENRLLKRAKEKITEKNLQNVANINLGNIYNSSMGLKNNKKERRYICGSSKSYNRTVMFKTKDSSCPSKNFERASHTPIRIKLNYGN